MLDVDGAMTQDQEGGRYWYDVQGRWHRDGNPAVILSDGFEAWFRHGLRHRDDGAAVIFPDGTQQWWSNGHLHRSDGPAVATPDADGCEWWLHGRQYSEEAYLAACAERLAGAVPAASRRWRPRP